jgi:putative transposase
LSYSQILQAKLKDLDNALKFKKNGRGFPHFKSKWAANDSFRYTQGAFLIGNKVRLPKIGDVKIKLHRDLPSCPSSTSVFKENNNWYVSFIVDKQENELVDIDSVIGIDVNADIIATSNNELIKAPRPNRKYKKQLKSKQRNISRKTKKSKNRAKARILYKKLSVHVANIRKDFLHETSARIAKSSALVCTETLDIEQMKKNHYSAIAIQDSGWRTLFDMLKYKTKLIGHHYHQINQWLASSKTCNSCGHKKEVLDITERKYECDECGVIQHRDINAACNIEFAVEARSPRVFSPWVVHFSPFKVLRE